MILKFCFLFNTRKHAHAHMYTHTHTNAYERNILAFICTYLYNLFREVKNQPLQII